MAIKIVIDTNVLVTSLSSRSMYHWIIRALLTEKIELFISGEIILEYEEILKLKYSTSVADNFLTALQELPNVHETKVYYQWKLLKDEDDNKFADCYLAAGADYLVTNDSHFSLLKTIDFPAIKVVSLDEFERTLLSQ
jgi:putative PIN family toxin of toxin-antitoxin system